MNNQMTSKTARVITAKALMLVSLLLLGACDGGIFGTGGAEDMATSVPDNAGLPNESLSETNLDTTTNATGDVSDSDDAGAVTSEGDTGGVDGATAGAGTTAGDGVGTPDVDTGGGASTSATDGATDTGTIGTGATDSGTADAGTDDADDLPFELSVTTGDNGAFINAAPTLSSSDAQLLVVNTSSLTLNIISRGTDPEAAIFEIAGVAPNTSSESTTLNANVTNLAIVESNNPTQVLISYTEFIADPSTVTTLFIREDDSGINSVALVTETQTSGPGLAKVRIVQAGTLGDTSLESQLRLQSAGENPGGVDINFGTLSFDRPQSDYIELFAGDYELIDLASRFSPVAVTLLSESVYTLLLIGNGNGTNDVLTIIDSETQ